MTQQASRRPRIALTLGDPAGIGPEVVRGALLDPVLSARARWLCIGPRGLAPEGMTVVPPGDRAALRGDGHLYLVSGELPPFQVGRAQAQCGRAALDALRVGHDLALSGDVEALVTAPVSKEALALAGERVEGQTQLLARWANAPGTQMMAVAGNLRVLLLTRHVPLAEAIRSLDGERVVEHLALLHGGLRWLGIRAPRLALAGLNPHAGEGGLLGAEEGAILEPAVERARARGLDVAGPISPDTVFQQAARGRFDGVLALYHDQAFIPVKLLDPDGGLTVLLGLPYLRVSPAHGTAFDIAGKGLASARPMANAMAQTVEWVLARG